MFPQTSSKKEVFESKFSSKTSKKEKPISKWKHPVRPKVKPLKKFDRLTFPSRGSDGYYKFNPIPRYEKWSEKMEKAGSKENLPLSRIAEDRVTASIHHDPAISHILSLHIQEIGGYLKSRRKPYKIGVTLQDDPEDPEFKAFVIVINTSFKDLKEKLNLEQDIGHLISSLRSELLESEKSTLDDLKRITYWIDTF